MSTRACSGALGFSLTSRNSLHAPAPRASVAAAAPTAALMNRLRIMLLMLRRRGSERGAEARDEAAGLRLVEPAEVLAAGVGPLVDVALGVAEREVAPDAQVAPGHEHRGVVRAEPAHDRAREAVGERHLAELHEARRLD